MQEGQSSVRQEQSNIPSGTVTFLFTDIEGSTKLLEALRELYALVLDEHRQIFRAAFGHWNGLEIDTLGVSVRVRMGLHTGEPA
jgi:class 3 adenylate cyclase